MIQATATIQINAPIEKVFDAAASGREQLIWDASEFKDFKQLTPGPIGKGSRFSCRVKGMGKMIYEFASYDRPHSFVHKSTTWMSYGIHDFDFRKENNTTSLTQTMQLRFRGIARLFGLFLRGKLRNQLIKVNQELKNFVEHTDQVQKM